MHISDLLNLSRGYQILPTTTVAKEKRRHVLAIVLTVLLLGALLFAPSQRYLQLQQAVRQRQVPIKLNTADAAISTRPPSRRIAIVMHNSNDTAMLNSEVYGSNSNHRTYAEIHGYHFLLDSQPYVNWTQRSIPSGWIKSSGEHGYNKLIHLMDSILHGIRSAEYDWVFWADGDSWISNPSILLESYLPPDTLGDEETAPYFLAAQDENGFNDGTFFLKVNYWSYSFLAQAFAELYKPQLRPEGYSDQRSICRTLILDKAAAKHFWRVPQSWFNQYPGILSSLSKDIDIHDFTLQIHLVDKLKRDEDIFRQNMDRVAALWDRSRADATALLRLADSLTDLELLEESAKVLPYDAMVRDITAKYWQEEARPGIKDIKWLDIQ